MNALHLLMMEPGEYIQKGRLARLIRDSKRSDSDAWLGEEYIINNTPQQGINWIGNHLRPAAVLIKSYPGRYESDLFDGSPRYALKSRSGIVVETDKANQVLIRQQIGGYPLMYFVEFGGFLIYVGKFQVKSREASYIVLEPYIGGVATDITTSNIEYSEGALRMAIHNIRERNPELIRAVKVSRAWRCDICQIVMEDRYGVRCIEAHHKTPISKYDDSHETVEADVVLLCPNCHSVVHIIMSTGTKTYQGIKEALQQCIDNK